VTWNCDLENEQNVKQTYTVELRHGRRTGIRKIYVNKELVDRSKDIVKVLHDSGGQYPFRLGTKTAEIEITNKGFGAGYAYKLTLDGNPIEQQTALPQGGTKPGLDIGVRAVQLPKSANGLGMTLRNNPLGNSGVVVWTVEEGKAAASAGIQIGDVVLSVEEHLVDTIDNLIDYVAASKGVVNMELAGTGSSKTVVMRKEIPGQTDPNAKVPIGLGLQTTSCGIGILITEIDSNTAAAYSGLGVGDCILSIEDTVPKSPKHAVELILGKPESVKFIVVDSTQEAAPR